MLGGHGHARHALAPVAAVAAASSGFRSRWCPRRWRGHVDPMGPLCWRAGVSLRLAAGSTQLRPPKRADHRTLGDRAPGDRSAGRRGAPVQPWRAGESGVIDLPVLASLFPSAVRDDFTLVSFDERGTARAARFGVDPRRPRRPAPSVQRLRRQCLRPAATDCAAKYPAPLRVTTSTPPRTWTGSAPLSVRARSATTASPTAPSSVRSMRSSSRPCASHGPRRAVDTNLSLSRQATEEAPAIDAALRSALPPCAAPARVRWVPVARHLQRPREPPPAAPAAARAGATTPVTVGDLFNATLLYLSVPPSSAATRALERPRRATGRRCERCRSSSTRTSGARRWSRRSGRTPATTPRPTERQGQCAARPPTQCLVALAGAAAVSNNLIGCVGWRPGSGTVPTLVRTSARPARHRHDGDPHALHGWPS